MTNLFLLVIIDRVQNIKESAMLINLSDAFTSEGYVAKRQAETELTRISCRMGDFPIIEKTPLALTLTNLGTNKASIEGRMELTLGE